MNDRKAFIPKFGKDGKPKKGYSEWGERLNNIKVRKELSEALLKSKAAEFRNEYVPINCINCGSSTARKIYLFDNFHYAKYECVRCYRNLKWVSKKEY
jgi:transposase-like protein